MLDLALKEWAVVCDLLLEGRMALLLRKGGIAETAGPGCFEIEHPRFLLFPSWAHQKPGMIQERYRDRVQVLSEPQELALRAMGEVTHVRLLREPAPLLPGGALYDLHPWTSAQVEMRFVYKPENPLYLLIVRVKKLVQPKTIPNRPAYGGCRSWVPLAAVDAVDELAAEPVLHDKAYQHLVGQMDQVLGPS